MNIKICSIGDYHANWHLASGHPRGWRIVRSPQTGGMEELTTDAGNIRYFQTRERAEKALITLLEKN